MSRNSASLHTSRYIERKAVMNNSEESSGVPPYFSPEVQSICREVSGQVRGAATAGKVCRNVSATTKARTFLSRFKVSLKKNVAKQTRLVDTL